MQAIVEYLMMHSLCLIYDTNEPFFTDQYRSYEENNSR
jgi:hypothetical protein